MVGGLPALLRPTCCSAWVTETALPYAPALSIKEGYRPWEVTRSLYRGLGISLPHFPGTAWLEVAGVGQAVTNGTGRAAEFSLVIASPDKNLLNHLVTVSGGSDHGPLKFWFLPKWIWICFQTSVMSCLCISTYFPNTRRST